MCQLHRAAIEPVTTAYSTTEGSWSRSSARSYARKAGFRWQALAPAKAFVFAPPAGSLRWERGGPGGETGGVRIIRRTCPSLAAPSAFAGFRFPPHVIVLAVRWYLRFGLSYRDVEELLAERGVEVDHVTLYRWVQRFAPLLAGAARPRRHAAGAARPRRRNARSRRVDPNRAVRRRAAPMGEHRDRRAAARGGRGDLRAATAGPAAHPGPVRRPRLTAPAVLSPTVLEWSRLATERYRTGTHSAHLG